MATTPQSECCLLALPPELRTAIRESTLYVGKVYLVEPNKHGVPPVRPILQTCRQIRDEAQPIYYQINEIQTHVDMLPRPIRVSSTDLLDCLTGLVVGFYLGLESVTAQCLRLLPKLRNLKTLKIVQMGSKYSDEREAENILEAFAKYESHFMLKLLKNAPSLEKIIVTHNHPGVDAEVFKKIETTLQHAIDSRQTRGK